MARLDRVAEEKTELDAFEIDRLQSLVSEWTILSDLALSDLVLWLPTWNDGGFVAAAQIRPTTAPTAVPEDVIGSFVPKARRMELDRALARGVVVRNRDADEPHIPGEIEGIPVYYNGRIIGVIARHTSQGTRIAGRLEEVYLASADDLIEMVSTGAFPPAQGISETQRQPRVGDGVLRLDRTGVVEFASPNAVSALRRLGLATDVVGANLGSLVVTLSHRPGPVDEALALIAGGRVPGSSEVENRSGIVTVRGQPLLRAGKHIGALVLVRDVTDLRRRERALMSKDATIREIHHRVKNNLQTVAALLRLQSRRVDSGEAKEALAEAGRRVGAIAAVHETLSLDPGDTVSFDDVADRVIALVAELSSSPSTPLPQIRRTGSLGKLPADQVTPLAMATSELIQNAVEHAGATTIEVQCERADHDVMITVIDDGKGIGTAADESTGLGLDIVRSLIVDDLGGEFSIADRRGGGTRAKAMVPATSAAV